MLLILRSSVWNQLRSAHLSHTSLPSIPSFSDGSLPVSSEPPGPPSASTFSLHQMSVSLSQSSPDWITLARGPS